MRLKRACIPVVLSLVSTASVRSFVHNTSTQPFHTTAMAGTAIFAPDRQVYPPDEVYPGTAVERMMAIRARVRQIATSDDLNEEWDSVRRKVLWAGGLKDLENAAPGRGYTGHSFNDYNHCDLTAMLEDFSSRTNDGQVRGIHQQNFLGAGIKIASIPELGPGGSWSTCMLGCNVEPPRDVAHVQFRSRIAFKLVWCPPTFTTFVLVDDDGNLLAKGSPKGTLPNISEREMNYALVKGSKYAKEAGIIASSGSSS